MVRNYKKKKEQANVNRDKLKQVKALVSNGMSIRKAGKQLGLHEASIRRHLKAEKENKTIGTVGIKTALPENSEEELALMLTLKAKWGFASSREEVKSLVQDFVRKVKGTDTPEGGHLAKYCKFKVSSFLINQYSVHS